MKKNIDRILKDSEFIYDNEGNWRSYYQDLANFCLPRKAWVNSIRIQGERLKDNFLYDIRAIRCAKESVCGFHSHLTNPSARWFETRFVDDKTMQYGEVQRYLKVCDDIQFDVINDSNFDDGILENYMDHIVFGTGNIQTMEDEEEEVRFSEIPVEQYSFACDARGRLLELYRRFSYTALQCASMKEWNLPKEVNDALSSNPYIRFDIIQYIGPRDYRDPYKKDNLNMPWRSLWIMKKPEHLLYESGFNELPNAVGRWWKDANDPRGFSPAMDALASIKLLNAEKRTFIRHAMKASDPAWMAPYRSFLNQPNFNPSAANYYDAKNFKPDSFRFLHPEGNSNLNIEAMNEEAAEIERAFFVDIFRAISNVTLDKKKRSVPEVQRLIAEGMTMLGPIVGKLINETLDPTLERVRAILDRRLLFPPMPEQLKDKKKKIIYLSPLARAQKQSQMNGLMSWLQIMAELSQFKQEALDNVDADRISRIVADIQGVDPTVYLPERQVAQIRQQRAKMQAAAQQAAIAEQAAGAAQKAGSAKKNMAEAEAVGV